jgi:hypothetical protein
MEKARGIEEDESFTRAKRAKLLINVSDSALEEDLRGHVDKLYLDMDEVFSFAKFHDGTLKFIDVEVLDGGDDDVAIEFRDAWALPFEIHEVMDAMWAYLGKRPGQHGCQEDARTVRGINHAYFGDYIVSMVCSLGGRSRRRYGLDVFLGVNNGRRTSRRV